MFKSPASKPWTCARCISKQFRAISQRRLRSTAAASFDLRPAFVDNTAPGAKHDDTVLRNVFDSKDFWKEFSASSKVGYRSKSKSNGLFRNKWLKGPEGFMEFAQHNLRKAQRVVNRVLAARTTEEYRNITRDLDFLSDMLCRVIDLCDFVRSTHPEMTIRQHAHYAHSMMFEYMNQLNTTTGLNEQLAVAMANEEIWNSWSEEEKVVAKALKKDFTNSAIALPKAMRDRFVTLSQEIADVGQAFVEDVTPARSHVSFPSSKLKGLDPRLAKSVTKWSTATIPVSSDILPVALRTVQDEDLRKELYIASRAASKEQLNKLDVLLEKRAELAKLTKFDSFAHLELGDKMARSPESVVEFLQSLSQRNKARVSQEIDELTKAKLTLPDASGALQPWDVPYMTSMIRMRKASTTRLSDVLSSYFSLGTVMQGLSRLFSRLYGIRFIPREADPGETWNSDVRALDIVSETDGHVAVLYCDLFSRPGKSPNPAHFTLRCSREIHTHEVLEESQNHNPLFDSPEEAANDGMSISRSSGALKQLPTIALICDFRPSPNKPALLDFREVETLFHEMGHAIHSILGRTSLQEVSGTRCATDFAELPSVLMEHFAADRSVLALFARHYETDMPLPYELVQERIAQSKTFKGLNIESQIQLAMADQAFHSEAALDGMDTSAVYHDIQTKWGVGPPDPPECSYQGFFGHLYGYGAKYYSYLFDQILADRIWQQVFKAGQEGGSIDRSNGERMKESVLKWGGGRDPWKCLAEVLDDGRVANGGKEAMNIVGSWGNGS